MSLCWWSWRTGRLLRPASGEAACKRWLLGSKSSTAVEEESGAQSGEITFGNEGKHWICDNICIPVASDLLLELVLKTLEMVLVKKLGLTFMISPRRKASRWRVLTRKVIWTCGGEVKKKRQRRTRGKDLYSVTLHGRADVCWRACGWQDLALCCFIAMRRNLLAVDVNGASRARRKLYVIGRRTDCVTLGTAMFRGASSEEGKL